MTRRNGKAKGLVLFAGFLKGRDNYLVLAPVSRARDKENVRRAKPKGALKVGPCLLAASCQLVELQVACHHGVVFSHAKRNGALKVFLCSGTEKTYA